MSAPAHSPAKREQILDGATSVFRELGYQRASVDAIAAAAGVSKATIYNHFRDKEALFLATVDRENRSLREKFVSLLETPTGDVEADLRTIGEQLLRLVGSPASVLRYRIVTAEAGRFPGAGRALYECGILAGRKNLARFLEKAARMGALALDDPEEAAIDFAALCLDNARSMLHLGIVDRLSDELVEREVDRAVRTFLRAYRHR
ncbi:MAG TPA: TetR/AcrR family transcriptional regulator [Vulgatibacter sp.]|nr:TetR/AcrR family transcriptional regulator [Vulgatibacter sp.]